MHADDGSARDRRPLNAEDWAKISLGGFLLTGLMAGVGMQWFMSDVGPGPARPYALVNLGLVALSFVASTLIMGRLVGVRARGEWLRAVIAVAVPLVAVTALVALSFLGRGE